MTDMMCPLCGSFYAGGDEVTMGSGYDIGEVCDNQSYRPKFCTPKTPCKGVLVPYDQKRRRQILKEVYDDR